MEQGNQLADCMYNYPKKKLYIGPMSGFIPKCIKSNPKCSGSFWMNLKSEYNV